MNRYVYQIKTKSENPLNPQRHSPFFDAVKRHQIPIYGQRTTHKKETHTIIENTKKRQHNRIQSTNTKNNPQYQQRHKTQLGSSQTIVSDLGTKHPFDASFLSAKGSNSSQNGKETGQVAESIERFNAI